LLDRESRSFPAKGNTMGYIKWHVDLVSHPKVTLS